MISSEQKTGIFRPYTKSLILTAGDPRCMRNYTFKLTKILCRLATAKQQCCNTCMVSFAVFFDIFKRMFH